MEKEKGFLQKIKDTLFGEDEEDFNAEGYTEENPSREEQELSQITESVILSAEKPAQTETTEEAKTETKKSTLQKVSKEEMEAIEENKPVIEILKTVIDPELQIDIWTLGLIYNIKVKPEQKEAEILLTFTSIMCPVGPMIVQSVDMAVKKIPSIEKVHVEVTFNPPWEPTDELREMLGV